MITIVDAKNIAKTPNEYDRLHYVHKFTKLDDMGQFLIKHKLSKFSQRTTGNVNSFINVRVFESVRVS